MSNIIFDNQSNLVSHSYYIILNVKKLYPKTRKAIWDIQVVNMYDNSIS